MRKTYLLKENVQPRGNIVNFKNRESEMLGGKTNKLMTDKEDIPESKFQMSQQGTFKHREDLISIRFLRVILIHGEILVLHVLKLDGVKVTKGCILMGGVRCDFHSSTSVGTSWNQLPGGGEGGQLEGSGNFQMKV